MRAAARLRNRIDPRIERSRDLILRAALVELGEVGYGAFTIESVAARAGVGKSTIYRHWPDKLRLITAAFHTFHRQQAPDLAASSPRERIERILHHVAEVIAGSTFSQCIPALVDGAERDAAVRRFHHRFQKDARRPLVAAITEGIAAGDFPVYLDADMAAIALLGVLFYRRLMSAEPFDPERAGRLAETVLGPETIPTPLS